MNLSEKFPFDLYAAEHSLAIRQLTVAPAIEAYMPGESQIDTSRRLAAEFIATVFALCGRQLRSQSIEPDKRELSSPDSKHPVCLTAQLPNIWSDNDDIENSQAVAENITVVQGLQLPTHKTPEFYGTKYTSLYVNKERRLMKQTVVNRNYWLRKERHVKTFYGSVEPVEAVNYIDHLLNVSANDGVLVVSPDDGQQIKGMISIPPEAEGLM